MREDRQKAKQALQFIIPILEKYGFKWCITGGFAAYAYGVPRNLTDIDIDIDADKDSEEFKSFLKDIESYVTSPFVHWQDQNYDNWNVEATYNGQLIDMCPMNVMLIFDKKTNQYEPFYKDGFPEIEEVDFEGLKLPLLSKRLVIKNKEMLVWQRDSDRRDIDGLRAL